MLCWMDHQNHHSAGTLIDCSCPICSVIAENDEVVAVETFIDVGNILAKSLVGPTCIEFTCCFPSFFTPKEG